LETEFRRGAVTGTFLALGAFLGIVMLAIVVIPAFGVAADPLWVRIAAVLGMVVAFDVLTFLIGPTRWIEFDTAGVTIGYLVLHYRIPWRDLQPSPNPPIRGWWAARSPAKFTLWFQTRPHLITVSQAQRLLASPFCPKWSLPPEVVSSLNPATADGPPTW